MLLPILSGAQEFIEPNLGGGVIPGEAENKKKKK